MPTSGADQSGRHDADRLEVDARSLTAAADRLAELADAAELMGDDSAATGLREQAVAARMAAMNLFD